MSKTDNYISIYEQRYETYRHLDKLRWYIFQVGMSVIGAIISFYNKDDLLLIGIGLILLSTGLIMLKVNHGIDRNNVELKKVALKLGDDNIPDIHNRSKFHSTCWMTSFALTLAGITILLYKIYLIISPIIIKKYLCL